MSTEAVQKLRRRVQSHSPVRTGASHERQRRVELDRQHALASLLAVIRDFLHTCFAAEYIPETH
jgi:hypothetical protein